MSDSTKEGDQVAYGFIACAGVALLFIIGKKVFYDIYCKEQRQENENVEDTCEI